MAKKEAPRKENNCSSTPKSDPASLPILGVMKKFDRSYGKLSKKVCLWRLIMKSHISNLCSTLLMALAVVLSGVQTPCSAGPIPSPVRLHGHVPTESMAKARGLGRVVPDTQITMAFTLPLRNQSELQELLGRIYDPADQEYGHYLTPREFTDRFSPTQADYDAVVAYAQSMGLTVTGTHPNRTLLDVTGSAVQVESAFNLRLQQYQTSEGRKFHAPDNDPEVPDALASRIEGLVGLDNAAIWHAQSHFTPAADMARTSSLQIGTGPGGGLTPGDILTAYNLQSLSNAGVGQVLGLFELDGYNPSDVANYVAHFGLRSVPIQNILVDGFSGRAGSGASEVTLDIELQNALAPGASKIIVYEGPNSSTGVVDTYNRIATDNLVKQISTSWGLSEGQSSSALLNNENAAFQQMAAQGQSIYAASGDSGAYDNGVTLSVDDPASQPYMVGVGGTQLYLNNKIYDHETTWNVNNTVSGGAGGGGVSNRWSIPTWQQGITSAASTTMRNVPDVSLNSDQYTGYSIFYKGGWYIFGGTSCASPLWAAFTARVNQLRVAQGNPPLGFANPAIYAIASGARYGNDFHDVTNGMNLYYSATTGYDNATGWGSFNGANLLTDLVATTVSTPAAPTGLTAAAGNGTIRLNWTASTGATSYNVQRGTASGAESPLKSGITTTTYTDGVVNGTTYYYNVSATNSTGTSDPSNEVSATPTAPTLTIIAGPTATATTNSAQIQWSTNVAANSTVNYGTTTSNLNKTVSNSRPVTAHLVSLSSLSRRTTYYYQVSSTSGSTTVSSAVNFFRTN